MRIGFFISSHGGSPMTVGLENGLRQLGHHVEEYRAGNRYDLLLVFNQSAHTTDYVYPAFPDPDQRFAFVDTAEYGYFRRFPAIIPAFAHAFRSGSLQHDTKNQEQQHRLRDFLHGKSFPYFLREHSRHWSYGPNYHPIDYPIYHASECHFQPNKSEYLNRSLELFCSWGLSHPWRKQITEALRGCHVKAEIFVIEENGTPRMPQKQYFGRTRAAKASVSYDGYGSGSFRITEVLCRTVLLAAPLQINVRAPLTDGVNCIEYHVEHDGETFISTDVCEKLRWLLTNQEHAFEIYRAGFHHCFEHYTQKATAQYVLDKTFAHDSTVETSID